MKSSHQNHTRSLDIGAGWEHIPRWLRIVLSMVAIGAVILVLYLTR